jgi:hypothetical protein
MNPEKGTTMIDRIVQRRFLAAKRECLNRLLALAPADKRVALIKKVKAKAYGSAVRYYLRANFPSWPDVMIEDYGSALINDYTSIKNSRTSLASSGKAGYDPIEKHWEDSLETIRRAFRTARPSGAGVEGQKTSRKTYAIGSVMAIQRPVFTIAISPAYKRLTDRIGTTFYKNYVILSGFHVLAPFDDAEVWCCDVMDAKERKTKTIYLGRHGAKGDEIDFVAHTNLAACITAIEKVVAKKCMLAMRGEED